MACEWFNQIAIHTDKVKLLNTLARYAHRKGAFAICCDMNSHYSAPTYSLVLDWAYSQLAHICTGKQAGVFFNGKWIDKEKMDGMLSDLAKRNTANRDQFDWKKRKEF